MNDDRNLVYKCFLEGIPVLEIYQNGSYKVLTEDDPEIAELMKQAIMDMNALMKIEGRGPLTRKEIDEAFVAETAEAYRYRGAISNAERLKRHVAECQPSIQELKEPRYDSHGSRLVANDAKYDAAFETLEKFGFSPNNQFLPLGLPDVEYFGEGEPWIASYERTSRELNDPLYMP